VCIAAAAAFFTLSLARASFNLPAHQHQDVMKSHNNQFEIPTSFIPP
jgi:hypothetical protein